MNSGVPFSQPNCVACNALDLSGLVGREISVYSEQFPGKELKVRVVSVNGRQLHVESMRQSVIENLVIKQTVILQFSYKGESISVRAMLYRSVGGRSYFELEEKAVPLSQRKHRRIAFSTPVRLAPFPINTFARRNLARLRWMATETTNFSSGGVMLEIPSYLEHGVYLLMNIALKSAVFPQLILGRVRHCHPTDNNRFRVGVEFLVKEAVNQVVPLTTARELPPVVMSYSVLDRERLNRLLQAWTPDTNNPLL